MLLELLGQEGWSQRQSNTIGVTLDTPIHFAFSPCLSLHSSFAKNIDEAMRRFNITSNELSLISVLRYHMRVFFLMFCGILRIKKIMPLPYPLLTRRN